MFCMQKKKENIYPAYVISVIKDELGGKIRKEFL